MRIFKNVNCNRTYDNINSQPDKLYNINFIIQTSQQQKTKKEKKQQQYVNKRPAV